MLEKANTAILSFARHFLYRSTHPFPFRLVFENQLKSSYQKNDQTTLTNDQFNYAAPNSYVSMLSITLAFKHLFLINSNQFSGY